ncbi:MAG: hypothetical protein CMN00_00535 [Rickettsiales bacterium]|nr:hypothetical protein [Rickettsiales bacterium]
MEKFSKQIYNKIIFFSSKKTAWIYLSFISFIESIIFPVPTDIFLAPIIISQRSKTIFLIFVTVLFSVLGGILGYFLGQYLWDLILPSINFIYPNFDEGFNSFEKNFLQYGWFLVIIGGFTPFPYKIITISSGILQLDLLMFIVCSILSRGARFSFVGFMFFKFGESIKNILEKYLNLMSIILITLFILYVYYKFF